MDLTAESINYLISLPPLNHWEKGSQIFKTITKQPSSHWLLPAATCRAAGKTGERALPVVAAIIALHTSIIMVDDILDQDEHFETLGLNNGDVSNLAQAFAFAGINAITGSDLEPDKQILILKNLSQMMVSTALGQDQDKYPKSRDESEYWAIVRAKSSPFFASAFYVGALAGGLPPEMAQKTAEIGGLYGEMVQVHDDLRDALETPASQDWDEKHLSLPILFASSVNHPQREYFIKLRQSIHTPSALLDAQKILLSCGAVSYCTHQLVQRHEKVQQILSTMNLPDRTPVEDLFKRVIEPVYQLFDKIGAPLPR